MLKINSLNKTYKGTHVKALHDINLSVDKGEFLAVLGPNGAGKSSLINCLAGNVVKDSGSLSVGGYELDTHELDTKSILGIVPQEISFDSFFTVNEVLNNQSGFFGIKDNQDYIDYLLTELSLIDKKHTNTRMLSGGMKRRLLIAKALVHKPKFFILDEPTAGVDIELRQSLYAFLRKLHKDGLTILLTTHYLEEAEKLCDRIVIINGGRIILDDSKKSILGKFGGKCTLEDIFLKLTKKP